MPRYTLDKDFHFGVKWRKVHRQNKSPIQSDCMGLLNTWLLQQPGVFISLQRLTGENHFPLTALTLNRTPSTQSRLCCVVVLIGEN